MIALLSLLGVTLIGVIGYLFLGFTLLEAVYQTVTTITTVGYREVRELTAAGEIFTIILIVIGVGTVLYNLGVLLEAISNGGFFADLERRRMDKRIAGMSGHVIVCGYGRVGRATTEHLLSMGHQVVVVDTDAARLRPLSIPHLRGDVTQDGVLQEAGITKARALVATLEQDADTVYVVLSARALAPDMVIIARARTVEAKAKMVLAGANRAVNPQLIGGRRIAAFALQPDVAEFLDVVMHDAELDFRIEQVKILAGSPLIGRTLGELDLTGRSGAQLLALREPASKRFVPSPPPESMLGEKSVLIAFGTSDQLEALKALAH